MKKKILALFLSIALIGQTGISVYAENNISQEVQEEEQINNSSEQENQLEATVSLLQEGALEDVFLQEQGEDILKAASYEWEDELRGRLIRAINTYQTEVSIQDLKIPWSQKIFSDIANIYQDILNTNPQFFFVSGYIKATGYGNFKSIELTYEKEYLLADSSLFLSKVEEDRKAYEKRVTQVISSIDSKMTDVEAALAVHDFLVRECDYDYLNYKYNQIPQASYSAYGALVNHTAVCQGYALAYLDIMNRLGISCRIVTSSAMNHAWNMLYLDGNWYHADLTWDDPINSNNDDYIEEGKVSHKCFLLSDSEIMQQEHYGWSKELPAASKSGSYAGYCFRNYHTAMNYFNGIWYYLLDGKVVGSNIEGTNISSPLCSGTYEYMHGIGNTMYLSNESGIYLTEAPDFSEVKNYKIWSEFPQYSSNYKQTEFTIKGNFLIAVLQYIPLKMDSRIELLPEKILADVPAASWQYLPAKYVYQRGIMTGKGYDENGNIIFAPNDKLDREQFAQVLYSMEGKPEVTYANIFADMQEGQWYTNAIIWAAKEGIISGYNNGKFGVGDSITREQIAAILYQYAQKKGYDISDRASFDKFTDASMISSWATNQLQWAVANGIMSGKGEILDPRGNATRAECAAMLRTFLEKFER